MTVDMPVPLTPPPLEPRSTLADLQARRRLCQYFIDLLAGLDDPRREDAIAEYQRQLKTLDGMIAALAPPANEAPAQPAEDAPPGKPPAVVVGLKPARLFAKEGNNP